MKARENSNPCKELFLQGYSDTQHNARLRGREEVPCRAGKSEGLRVRRRHTFHPTLPARGSLAEHPRHDLELVINRSEISDASKARPRHQETFHRIHITSPHVAGAHRAHKCTHIHACLHTDEHTHTHSCTQKSYRNRTSETC